MIKLLQNGLDIYIVDEDLTAVPRFLWTLVECGNGLSLAFQTQLDLWLKTIQVTFRFLVESALEDDVGNLARSKLLSSANGNCLALVVQQLD